MSHVPVIVPYRDSWPREFSALSARLRSALGERALRIEHIGSTSVPGLLAKDVIDVQISRLRRKIDKDFSPQLLHTVRGIGYMISADG